MLQAISSSWAGQASCASRSSLSVWILMLWSSYRVRNPTRTKTPVHNPESPPTAQQCRVTKHIKHLLVLKGLHMQKPEPKPRQNQQEEHELSVTPEGLGQRRSLVPRSILAFHLEEVKRQVGLEPRSRSNSSSYSVSLLSSDRPALLFLLLLVLSQPLCTYVTLQFCKAADETDSALCTHTHTHTHTHTSVVSQITLYSDYPSLLSSFWVHTIDRCPQIRLNSDGMAQNPSCIISADLWSALT